MPFPRFFSLCLLCLLNGSANAQVLARITVKSGQTARNNTPVGYVTEGITTLPADQLRLFEVKDKKRIPVDVQWEPGLQQRMWWQLSGNTPAGAQRIYELVQVPQAVPGEPRMRIRDNGQALLLEENGQPVLQYQHAVLYPPPGVDSLYARSGFIHPLWSPSGAVLTNIFPAAGHYHHMGIWNPWTHTSFKGRITDFWNVQQRKGTTRHTGIISMSEGMIWCGFKALQEQVALNGGRETVALYNVWDVKAYPLMAGGTRRIWDYVTTLSCAADSLLLLQYRYGGGFGLRTTAAWTNKTSQVLTSEGKTRKDADSTRARWVKITGSTPQGRAGMLIMNHPANFDSPEPLRVWPENMEGGELMLNFSPTKMKPWLLTHGHEYTLKYRVMVYNEEITPEEAAAAWRDYAFPPEISVQRVSPLRY